METTLSVLLPVRNAQLDLSRRVHDLLELLPDLTSHFEVVIVDDASNDHTEEICDDLVRRFPQLRVVRHVAPLGLAGAVETGLQSTSGEVVLVQEQHQPIRHCDFQKLWNQRHTREILPAAPAESGTALRKLVALLRKLPPMGVSEGGVRMVRREGEPRNEPTPVSALRGPRARTPRTRELAAR